MSQLTNTQEANAHARTLGDALAHDFGLAGEWVGGAESAENSREAAGLVQYKTTPNFISFSTSSKAERRLKRLKCNVYLTGQLHSMPRPGHRPDQAWLITLTYDTKGTLGKGSHNWDATQATRTTDRYRRWCKQNGYDSKYTWVCELQGNGTPHYHLVAWLPVGVRMPKWDRSNGRRGAFWRHGMSETAKLKTNCAYLMKYLSKMGEFHRFPHGMRLNGNGGLDITCRQIRSWHHLPQWVKNTYGVSSVKRNQNGYIDISTGEILPRMYRVEITDHGMYLHALRDPPPRLHDGPYCNFPRF